MLKILGAAFALVGAGLTYPARKIMTKIKHREPSDTEVLKLKLIGLACVVAGAAFILIDNMMK